MRITVQTACIAVAIVVVGCGSNSHLDGARMDLRNKNYELALERTAAALYADPNNSEALSLQGQTLLAMAYEESNLQERARLFSDMVRSFNRSMQIDSTYRRDHVRWMRVAYLEQFNEGMSLYDQAQFEDPERQKEAFEESARLFHAASKIFPDSVESYFNEASAYYSAGMLDAASEVYQLALDRGMKDRELFVYMTQTLENALEAQEDNVERTRLLNEIVSVLAKATTEHPRDSELLLMLLNAVHAAGDDVAARELYERELVKEGENKDFLYNYGTLLVRMGEYNDAIAMLDSAVALDPEYTNAQFNLGAAYVNKGAELSEIIRKEEKEFASARSHLAVAERERREAELRALEADRKSMYSRAIEHLVVAKTLTEADLGETRDICFALYQAYGQIEMRQKAEEVARCAHIGRQ